MPRRAPKPMSRVTIVFEAESESAALNELVKRTLKTALRVYRIRCVSVAVTEEPAADGPHYARTAGHALAGELPDLET